MGKWTKKVFPCTKTIYIFFLVKGLEEVVKCLLDGIDFFTMTSIIELTTQMKNIKLRSLKLIINSDAHKQMFESSFKRRFHDL